MAQKNPKEVALTEKDLDLSCRIGNVPFRTPFYISSGPTSKTVEQMAKAESLGWAGASIKLTFDPAPYINLPPRYGWFLKERYLSFSAETRLNVEEGIQLVKDTRKQTQSDFIVMANITYAGTAGIEGWVNMARRFQDVGSHIIELNFCCPNMSFNVSVAGKTQADHRTGASLGEDAEAVAFITDKVKKAVTIPVVAKITPEGGRIAQVAKAAYGAGADAVCSVANRLGISPVNLNDPAQSVYHLQGEPSMACMAGPWIKPLAMRDVYEIRNLVGPSPVITGTGGMVTWQDAVEMMMAGADMVGFCTGILLEGFELMPPLLADLKGYMVSHGYRTPRDFRDLLVKAVTPSSKLTIFEGVAKKKEECLAAPCTTACPAHVPANAYVHYVADGNYEQAYREIISKNPLQNVCGYVCSHPCETKCVRGKLEEPIRIREIKRFVLDMAKAKGWKPEPPADRARSERVAVIGSGPAGLSAAYDLARAGYKVVVFERDRKLGGMLRWAIPRFRLSDEVLDDGIADVKALGVEFRTNAEFGTVVTLDTLRKDGFDAVFIGVGAQESMKLGLANEDRRGCVPALDFLRDPKAAKLAVKKKRVAVIGGGFTAIDAARTAVRHGASEVFIVYRRTRSEMPAVSEEVDEAEEEGVQIMYLVSPKAILIEKGKVAGLTMVNHVLGEEDASGRRKPIPVKETEFTLNADVIITALGQEVALDEMAAGVRLTSWGTIETDKSSLATSAKGVFAGGDAVTGASNLVSAIAAGKRAAVSIDRMLSGKHAVYAPEPEPVAVAAEIVLKRVGNFPRQGRAPLDVKPATARKKNFRPCVATMTESDARAEAARCLNCGCGVACGVCYRVCMSMAIQQVGGRYVIDDKKCHACGMCFQRCPNMNIEMVRSKP